MKKEWNGLLVGPDEFEPKHPQLFTRKKVIDPQALRNARPEISEEESKILLEFDWGYLAILRKKLCLNINTGQWIQKIKKRHLLVLLNLAQTL